MSGTRLWTTLAIGLVTACGPQVVTTPTPAATGNQVRYAATPDTSHFVEARLISLDSDRLIFERVVLGQGSWVTDSLATESVSRLQVRIDRRNNAGKGALIGALVGVAAGMSCALSDPGWGWEPPSDGECFALSIVGGVSTGALIGLFIQRDVWAPAPLPERDLEPPTAPPQVSSADLGIGVQIPLRIPIP